MSLEVRITTTRGAATHAVEAEPDPTPEDAIAAVWKSIDSRIPIQVVSRDGRRERVAFNSAHVIDISIADA